MSSIKVNTTVVPLDGSVHVCMHGYHTNKSDWRATMAKNLGCQWLQTYMYIVYYLRRTLASHAAAALSITDSDSNKDYVHVHLAKVLKP